MNRPDLAGGARGATRRSASWAIRFSGRGNVRVYPIGEFGIEDLA